MERKANQKRIGKYRITNVANPCHRAALEVVVRQYIERGREAVEGEKRLQRGPVRVRVAAFCRVIAVAVAGWLLRLPAIDVAIAVAVAITSVTISITPGRPIEVVAVVIRPGVPVVAVPSVPVSVGVVAVSIIGPVWARETAVGERRAAVRPMMETVWTEAVGWTIAAIVRAVIFGTAFAPVIRLIAVGKVTVGPVKRASVGLTIGTEAAGISGILAGGRTDGRLLDVVERRLRAVLDYGFLSRPEVVVRREVVVGLIIKARAFLETRSFSAQVGFLVRQGLLESSARSRLADCRLMILVEPVVGVRVRASFVVVGRVRRLVD